MAEEVPVEKKFAILTQIVRASHFAWHEAVRRVCPEVKTAEVVGKMWEITAQSTAKAYLKRLNKEKPLPEQIARSFVWSSITMGEDAEYLQGKDRSEAFVKHNSCPWYEWHKRFGLLEEDRPGCDVWFFTVVREINSALGTNVKIETQRSLPDGHDSCLRRIWE